MAWVYRESTKFYYVEVNFSHENLLWDVLFKEKKYNIWY